MDEFLKALDALDPLDYPDAARTIVMRLSDSQFLDHRLYCADEEPKRRMVEETRAQEAVAIAEQLWEAHPELKPERTTDVEPVTDLDALLAQVQEWKEPVGKFDAYPPANLTKLNGRIWRNERRGLNANRPGTILSGWRDVTDELLAAGKAYAEQQAQAAAENETPAPAPEEPKQVTPANEAREWAAGLKIEAGIPWRHDGSLYLAKLSHTSTALNAPGNSTRHWQKLD